MNVAVLGGGALGASWAALFATVGRHRVRVWDPSPAAGRAFSEKMERARQQLVELGADAGDDVIFCDRIEEAVWGAEWVQESAPERADLKAQLYSHVESAVTRDAVIASSTASFTWSQLTGELRHPERFVIAHPFNPPHLVPVVELFCPNQDTLSRAVKFYTDVERVPVCMKREATGHIGNRLASALWREAVHIVAEGIADVEDVDKVLIHGPGMRWSVMGAHLGYHLGGGEGGIDHYLRHLGPKQEQRWASLGTPKLTAAVCDLIAAGVHREVGDRSIAELEAQRDEQLMEILRLRRAHPTIDVDR